MDQLSHKGRTYLEFTFTRKLKISLDRVEIGLISPRKSKRYMFYVALIYFLVKPIVHNLFRSL